MDDAVYETKKRAHMRTSHKITVFLIWSASRCRLSCSSNNLGVAVASENRTTLDLFWPASGSLGSRGSDALAVVTDVRAHQVCSLTGLQRRP
jgi:hypothetical protein